MAPASSEVTGLLRQWSAGDESARDRLIPLVYDRLRALAHRRLGFSPVENSLNTTELVHEAYIRLVGAPRVDLPDRAHFLALASEIMRNLLVDRARSHLTAKRGGGMRVLDLDEFEWVSDENLETVADLDEALKRLDALSTRQGQLLQHRYFGGLTLEESAAAMGVSLATAKRHERPTLGRNPGWLRPAGRVGRAAPHRPSRDVSEQRPRATSRARVDVGGRRGGQWATRTD